MRTLEDIDMDDIELKPCPFCGGENLRMGDRIFSFGTDIYIKCTCGAKIQLCSEDGVDKLINSWNTREAYEE